MKKLFIGSSREGLLYARKLKAMLNTKLKKYNIRCILWEDKGVFSLNKTTIENLCHVAENIKGSKEDGSDKGYAVMLMTPDDKIDTRNEVHYVARDNVIFELGLFIGYLGRSHVCCAIPSNKKIKMMSDWNGVNNARYQYLRKPQKDKLGMMLADVVEQIVMHIDRQEQGK